MDIDLCCNFPQWCNGCNMRDDGLCKGVIIINNLKVKCFYTPNEEQKFAIGTPDGRLWEDGLTFNEAIEYCLNTKDFID